MTNNTDGHAIWIVTLFSSEQWSGGILLTREAYARRKITIKRLKETNLG